MGALLPAGRTSSFLPSLDDIVSNTVSRTRPTLNNGSWQSASRPRNVGSSNFQPNYDSRGSSWGSSRRTSSPTYNPSIGWGSPVSNHNSVISTALGLTGVGAATMFGADLFLRGGIAGMDWFQDGAISEALRQNHERNQNRTTPADSVEVDSSVLNPFAEGQFNPTWGEENSPPLVAGTMQSAEIIALTIGSLIQITADNHVEHMKILSEDLVIKYQHGERISQSLESIVPLLLGVVETLNLPNISDAIITNANAISASIQTQPLPELITQNTISQMDVSALVNAVESLKNSPESVARNEALNSIKTQLEGIKTNSETNTSAMESLKNWSQSAKENEDFKKQTLPIHDLDGNLVTSVSPREIEAIKNASDARHKTDTNNLEFDDTDIPDMAPLPSLIGWLGRSALFDPKYDEPSQNPFIRSW